MWYTVGHVTPSGVVAKKITSLDRHLMFKDDSFFHVPDDFPKTKVPES